MPGAASKKDTYNFTILKKFPRYKAFEIVKKPRADFASSFMKTFTQMFKGE